MEQTLTKINMATLVVKKLFNIELPIRKIIFNLIWFVTSQMEVWGQSPQLGFSQMGHGGWSPHLGNAQLTDRLGSESG